MDVDLTQNVVKLLNQPEGRIAFVLYVIACIGGQFMNAGWLWLKRDIPCVMDRFKQDARATAVSMITNAWAVVGVALLMPWEAIPLQTAIVMGVFQGFSSDSAVNKSSRPVWTEEQRAANKKKDDPDATHPAGS